ncbi:hypothetical protein N9E20_02070 [Crocinitomicaceae bacterium]|nr:hypothetical protein [Crocinitomicaceae bacterium]
MCRKDLLESKIKNKEQIILSYNSNSVRVLNLIIGSLYLISIISVIYLFNISKITILSASIISFFYGIFFMSIKNYVSASIKGEMLLTKNIYHKNKITDLKSIRSIKSITLFGINYTKVKYKLDGVRHTIQMIKYLSKNEVGIDVILKSALKKAC